MIKAVFRFIGGVFRFLFRCVDFLRRALLNLVLIGVLAVIAIAWWKPAPGIDEGSVLVLRPSGMLVERTSASSPLDLIRPDSGAVAETALRDLLAAVRAAREDERIAALVIETDDLAGAREERGDEGQARDEVLDHGTDHAGRVVVEDHRRTDHRAVVGELPGVVRDEQDASGRHVLDVDGIHTEPRAVQEVHGRQELFEDARPEPEWIDAREVFALDEPVDRASDFRVHGAPCCPTARAPRPFRVDDPRHRRP